MKHNSCTFLVLALSLILSFGISNRSIAQEVSKDQKILNETYPGGAFYEVQHYDQIKVKKSPKNIILLIGDGMGLAHAYSAMTANGGHLFLENFRYCGFSKTYAFGNYVTDSAAGGTALACGTKTYNGAIGVDPDRKPLESILKKAEKKGMKTGLVATTNITDATPAAFIANAVSRTLQEDIAADFLKTDIDVFIGGGAKFFEERKDGRNISNELKEKGYQVLYKIEDISKVSSGKLAGLTAREGNSPMPARGEMLVPATETALTILSQEKKGFFLMVEGSEIDHLAHANNTTGVVLETLDFDKAIGAALKFATSNKETLVIVTADHETGGMTLNGGDYKSGKVVGKFTSTGHTGIPVPVYAFGPGADQFTGFQENTDVAKKMMKLLRLK